MQNDVANHTVNLNNPHDGRDERNDHHNTLCSANAGSYRVAVHRTWFFWSFILIPVLVILGWSQYVTVKGPVPWLGLGNVEHAEHWSDWMRYYVWLQLVWLPANMMIFLIWCALGVRIWNCKRMSRSQCN
jgi:hypothetical protein